MNELEIILSLGIGIFVFIFIATILIYVITAIALQRMANNRGIQNSWLAWIPIGNLYVIGELSTHDRSKNMGLILLIAGVGSTILSFIPVLGTLLTIGYIVFLFYVYYQLFKMYTRSPVLHLVLSILIPCYLAILLFVKRNEEVVGA